MNIHFDLPSNTILNKFGLLDLGVINEEELDYQARIISGFDVVEIIETNTDSIKLNISKQNSDFEIEILYGGAVVDKALYNTGEPIEFFKIQEEITVPYQYGKIKVPYEIKGLSKNDISISFGSYRRIFENDVFQLKDYKTFDIAYSPESFFEVIGARKDTGRFVTLESHQYVPTYNFYSYLYNLYNEEYKSIDFTFEGGFEYCGLSENENEFVINATNNSYDSFIEIEYGFNSSSFERNQEVLITIGDNVYVLKVKQLANPNGFVFYYDNSNIPAPLDYTKNLEYILPITIPEGFWFEVDNIDFNATGVQKPYQITYEDDLHTFIKFIINPGSPTDYLNKDYEQKITFDLYIYGTPEIDVKYRLIRQVELSIDASANIYTNGEILIDSYNEISGRLNVGNNNASSITVVSKPDWIDSNELIFDANRNIVYLQNVDENLTGESRSGVVDLRFNRKSGGQYENTVKINIYQDQASSISVHKTFEDVIIHNDSTRPEIIEIYKDNGIVYSGYIVDDVNLSDFTRDIFEFKNIFDYRYSNLDLLKKIEYVIGGSRNVEYFTYDYSYKDADEMCITDITQPIDYYDPRQYVFFGIYKLPDDVYEVGVDFVYLFGGVMPYNKYNYTAFGGDMEYYRYYWLDSVTGKHYGKTYQQKCTKAKYAIYYMNSYGCYNWMLFDSNKQTKSYNNTYNYFTTSRNEKLPYKISSQVNYDLTSRYLTDEGSERLKDLYRSPIVWLHNLETGELFRVNVDTKTYTEKSFINQGRKYYTQSIKVSKTKEENIY